MGRNELPKPIKDRLESREGKDSGGEVCNNLFFLGRKGVLVTSEGVRIVVLGGREGSGEEKDERDTTSPWYTTQEASALKGANSADILVTNDWPEGVDGNSKIPVPQAVEGGLPNKSRAVGELARRLRPKYHFFVGGEEVFWEREPYKNEVLGKERERMASGGAEVEVGVTRVIALANWGNKGKVKVCLIIPQRLDIRDIKLILAYFLVEGSHCMHLTSTYPTALEQKPYHPTPPNHHTSTSTMPGIENAHSPMPEQLMNSLWK